MGPVTLHRRMLSTSGWKHACAYLCVSSAVQSIKHWHRTARVSGWEYRLWNQENLGSTPLMGTVGWLLSTEKPFFFYRVRVDNLILPSQGDRKNSEFGSSQGCNRRNADMQGGGNWQSFSQCWWRPDLRVHPHVFCHWQEGKINLQIFLLYRSFFCIALYSENCSNSSDFRQLQGTGTAINTWKVAISGLYIICPFSLCTQRTRSGNCTDRCSHGVLPENYILLKCLTGRRLNRPSRLKHLSVPIITPLKAEEMRFRQEEPCLSSNLKSWNHKKKGRIIQHRTWNRGSFLFVNGSSSKW